MAHRLQNIAIFEKCGAKMCTHDTRMNCKRGCKNRKIKEIGIH